VAEAIQFYFNQHVPGAVARGLRLRGIDVLTAQEAGRCGLPDDEQLHFALTEERVLVTFDADYLVLAAQGNPHAGIAFAYADRYRIGQLISDLLVMHGVYSRDDMRNHVEYL
jgi:hypothetical protein